MTTEQLSRVIRKLRGTQSLRSFAEKCGISHTTIDNLEKGVDFRTGKPTQVKLSTLLKIFEACNIPEHLAYLAVSDDYEGLDEMIEAAAEGRLYGTTGGDGVIRKLGQVKQDDDLGGASTENDELQVYLEYLKTRPEMRMLFSTLKGATKEDVERAVKIIEALRGDANG